MYRRRLYPFDELQRIQEWINKAIGDIEPVSGRFLENLTKIWIMM